MTAFFEYISSYHLHWSLVLGASVVGLSWFWVKPRFGIMPAALLAYVCLSAFWVWAWRENRYVTINPYDQMALRYFACDSVAKALIVLVPILLLSENRFSMLFWGKVAATNFVVINCASILVEVIGGCYHTENACGGIVGNPSISVGMTITMLPFVIQSWRRQWYFILPVMVAVIASRSSIAFGLFAMYSFFWHLPWVRIKEGYWGGIKSLAISGLSCVCVFAVARIALGHELTNDSDRFTVWRNMMEAWAAPWNIAFGTGIGTYHVFSINIQGARHLFVGYWWNWMHSEPLQAIFELGAIGAALFAGTYCAALWRTLVMRENFPAALSVLLFGAYMTLDPALHPPLPSLWAAWLFVYALRQQDTIEEML